MVYHTIYMQMTYSFYLSFKATQNDKETTVTRMEACINEIDACVDDLPQTQIEQRKDGATNYWSTTPYSPNNRMHQGGRRMHISL